MTHPFDVATEETRKSNLLLQAALLRDMGDLEQASALFATAAEIEERLAREADARNDADHALRSWYSAASAWAHAGDFHYALTLLRALEARPDVPIGLRERIHAFAEQDGITQNGIMQTRRAELRRPRW
jgi:hypothetical protein